MAARRLKFKPKPLVGLIRRNKDQSEQDAVKHEDLVNGETSTQEANNSVDSTTPESAVQERISADINKNNDSTIGFSDSNKVSDCNDLNIREPIIEKENAIFNQINNETNDKNGENTIVQNDLKCDINNKIRSVLSGRSLRSCSPTLSDSNSCNSGSVNTDKNKVTQSDNDTVGIRSDSINDTTVLTVSESDESVLQRTFSGSKDTPVNNSELNRDSDCSDKADVNNLQSTNSVNDKKGTKNNSQRVLSRFGKARLKPSLSNVVRNKKDTQVEVSSKNDDRSLVLPEVTDVTKTSSSGSIDNSSTVLDNEERIIVVNESSNVVEECVQAENRENHNDHVSGEPCSDVVQLAKEPSDTLVNADLVITTGPVDKPVSNNNKSDATPKSAVECEIEDGAIRTPVKLFQPNKRQRSHGHSYTSLTIKAMQNFKDKFKDGPIDKSKLMMRDLIFYNPTSNPMPPRKVSTIKKDITKQESIKSNRANFRLSMEPINYSPITTTRTPRTKGMPGRVTWAVPSIIPSSINSRLVDELLEEEKVDDVQNDENDSLPVPQVKVGPDGKIIIDPRSLVIEATGVQKNRENLEKSEIVQENEFSYSKFHKKKVRRSDWTAEETLLFYKALNDLGADFSLMQSLFPKRTRRDLKLKFKKEERMNGNLIDKAMTSCGNFDFTALESELQKDREERVKRIEEMKRLAQEKRKLAAEMRKTKKNLVKRKSAAEREFNDTDRGIRRVGKEYETKVKELLKRKTSSEINVRKVKRNKKGVRRRRKIKRNLDDKDDDSSTQDDLDMFDFRLEDNINDDDNNTNDVSEDEGIIDKDDSLSLNSSNVTHTTSNDNDDSDSGFNSRILTKTRSGRQPKIKTIKDPATVAYIKQLKKFKQKNTQQKVTVVANTEHFVPRLPLMETVIFNTEKLQKLTSSEMQERLENCYQLFGEPLDLSVPSESEILIDRFDDGNPSNSENSYSSPMLSNTDGSELANSMLFAELDVEDTVNKEKNSISDALQIVEELTSEHENGVHVNESNHLYLQSSIQGGQDTPDKSANSTMPSCSQVSEDDSQYHNINNANTNGEINGFSGQRAGETQSRPSIIIKTLQPGRAQIQVVPKEQFSYIFRQSSNIILQNGSDECPIKVEESDDEIMTHPGIHCYPSSDHTYTSLVPKPPEPTYVILAPMNVQEFS